MIDTGTLPLSTAQRGIWIGQQIAPYRAVFNIAEAIELHGAIDPDLLRQALRQVAQEMDTIRARIVEGIGLPRQVVMPSFDDPIALLDLSDRPDPHDAAMRWMNDELLAPFDFATCATWVSAVLKLSEQRWIWYHRAHHIMLDGFSGGMVVQRVAELYTALRRGRPPSPHGYQPLSMLIENEAAYRRSERYARDRAYWKARMADRPEPVTLARRVTLPTGGLLRATALLPQAMVLRLRERIRGMNVSLPQALIALVAAYYFKMTGAEDLVFGLPVTARVGNVMRHVPGMMANAVPIRLAMSADATADALFVQVSRAVREALRYQQYRYEDLRRDLGLLNQDQHLARLGINIEPFDYELTFDEVRATPHNLSNSQMEDLTVFIYDRSDGSGLRIDFDANPGLYSLTELEAHNRRLCRLIETVASCPGIHLGDIDLLDAHEREDLERRWNDTDDTTPVLTVPAQFAAQARTMSDAIAVAFDHHPGRMLTYAELDRRSLALAQALAAQKIGPGDLVAVALPRSELVPVALLGILRSGAAYLPLDPDGPADRLTMMLADAAPVCVLTLQASLHRFEGAGIPSLTMDGPELLSTQEPSMEREPVALPPADPEATAYVLYTSGSTGRPKGVEVSHCNLSNLIQGMRQLVQPDHSDRLLSVTALTFDIAGLELFLPLAVGAQVVLAESATVMDPAAINRLVRLHGITLLQATPSLWRLLLGDPRLELGGVHALVGGETLSGELASRLLERTRQVTNLYGPTETTIWSTAMTLSADDIDPPPIGRPNPNTHVHVLDPNQQPVPIGAIGELHIGGDGVAKGYLNQPVLTAERFMADPRRPGGRLYATGDLTRWREDGVLEYLGRSDQQVKIRGHRIEPSEIETHLARHQAVAEAAVVAQPDPSGAPVLVAYLVAASGIDPVSLPDALRRHLASRVPEIMIPSLFVLVDALPQTPNGKLDRKGLPAPDWHHERDMHQTTLPYTDIERRLLALWKQVLGRDDVGVHDNFFEAGGDSLHGAELFVAIGREFNKEIPFGSLFRATTIAGLAALLEEEGPKGMLDMLLPLKPLGDRPPLFCLPPIIGFGWPYTSLIRHLHPEQPLYALQAVGLSLDPDRSDGRPDSIQAVAASYLDQIRTVQPHGPYSLLGWSMGGLVAHEMAAQLRRKGEAVTLLALLDSYPFLNPDVALRMDEAQQVELALAFLGLGSPIDDDRPTTVAELAGYICQAYGLMSQPAIQAVLQAEGDMMQRLTRVVSDNLALARAHVPEPVDVDAVFCHAVERSTEALSGVLDHHPDAWRPLVRSLLVHDIDCHHQDILSAEPARRIGSILGQHLDTGLDTLSYA